MTGKNTLLIAGAVALALVLGRQYMLTNTRGLRNNNPGNIKELPGDKTQWVGERATDDDPVFEEFRGPEYGIRAMARVLDSYQDRGLITVYQIISTWAPGSENDTESYIDSVCRETGMLSIQRVFREDYPKLIAAIIKHENGINPYSLAFIEESINLA